MSEPTQEILRRGEVVEWLRPLGFARWKTRQLIERGIIKEEHFELGNPPSSRNGGTTARQAKNGKNGAPAEVRAHFRKSQIKAALRL